MLWAFDWSIVRICNCVLVTFAIRVHVHVLNWYVCCALQPVDFSKWGGLWLPCAGSLTPWGTHLGSEVTHSPFPCLLPSTLSGTAFLHPLTTAKFRQA